MVTEKKSGEREKVSAFEDWIDVAQTFEAQPSDIQTICDQSVMKNVILICTKIENNILV